jgi:hypothetical protein
VASEGADCVGGARDVELDGVDALPQAEPRHAAHFVGPVHGNAETFLMKMKLAAIAQAAGNGQFRAGRQQARSVDQALIDGVAHRDVEPDLGGRRRTGAGEARAQQLACGVHGEQRMVFRRQFAQRRPARGVDEGQMGVTFDHARHQELARCVDSIGSVGGQRLGLRRDRDNPFALDEHLARKGRGAGAIPHYGIVNQ